MGIDPGSLTGFQIPGLSTGLSGGILTGLGGVAGAYPTPSSTSGATNASSSTIQNTQGTSDYETNLQTLLNTLQQIVSQQQGTSQQATTSTSTPNLSPQAQQLISKLTGEYLKQTTPDLRGYQATQTQGINQNSDINRQAVNAIMASRGLSTSPVAGTASAGIEGNRIAQINQLKQSIPLLQYQLGRENLAGASSFLSSLPYGTTTTGNVAGSTSQTGLQTQTGQQTGSQTGSGSQNTWGTNQTHNDSTQNTLQTTQSGGGVGSAIGGIASVLAGLFSDKRLKDDIKELPSDKAVRRVLELKPTTWKWKGSDVEDEGLIAQDLQKVAPELVHKDPNGTGLLKVNYAGLIGTLVGAVQGLKQEFDNGAS